MAEVAEPADEELVAGVAAGDREAFAALFGRYAGKVKSYLIRLGAPAGIAEDLAQEVMLTVWRRSAGFDAARARARTWIFVIARHAWIDRLRRERVELAYAATTILIEEDAVDSPDDILGRAATAAQVGAAVDALPPEQRQVVRLSFFEDRPHSDIAARLSLPLGTVKSRLRLALGKLRAQWENLS